MKLINRNNDRFIIRIDKAGEFEDSLVMVAAVANGWTLEDKSFSSLTIHHRIKELNKRPLDYPYIAKMNVNNENELIYVDYIDPRMFESSDEDNTYLFEFELMRTSNTFPYRQNITVYQIPGKDIFEATLLLGQTFHRSDVYDLKILNWKQVK